MNTASIGNAVSKVSYEKYEELYVQNSYLHSSLNTAGRIGLTYGDSESDSAFESILQNVSYNTSTSQYTDKIFGLDFRDNSSYYDSISNQSSSMQLGNINKNYEQSITWINQPLQPSQAEYHNFFIEDLQFCGNNILSNFSYNWQISTDTGSTCLTFPGEIYDSFIGWFDNNTIITNVSSLPAFSFRISNTESNPIVYIPLAELIIEKNAIINETGSPFINILQENGTITTKRLCVLRGNNIMNSFGYYSSTAPYIVFGAMVLKSMYFAANFDTLGVGIANKMSQYDIDLFKFNASKSYNFGCSVKVDCIGFFFFFFFFF
jgi:hypothetical protein